MPTKNNEKGFTYIEVIIAILIMTIGLLALLSAVSFAVMRARESEQRNVARQLASAAVESIFATRDLLQVEGAGATSAIGSFDAIANNTAATPQGIFLIGYNPIRQDSGRDQIEGTADDACAAGTNCTVGTYTNASLPLNGFQRQIVITDITETNVPEIRRKRVVISVKYIVGQAERIETITTVISKLTDDYTP